MELTDKNANGNYSIFNFTKAGSAVTLNPANKPSFNDIGISWNPDIQSQDCNGVAGGSAYLDNCGTCVGGNTGKIACVRDCNGVYGGTA